MYRFITENAITEQVENDGTLGNLTFEGSRSGVVSHAAVIVITQRAVRQLRPKAKG